jgi:uncharacterized protein YdeI (YjbR/CyaY-like superfamily)
MKLTNTFFAADPSAWHAWLDQHHAQVSEVWLVYCRARSGNRSISYEESVEEALCFGWVDSLIQKIDEERYARKFTPRRPGSAWSAQNLSRVDKLLAEGRMTPAGVACLPEVRTVPAPPADPGTVPAWLAEGLRKNPTAWENFQRLPPSHQRRYILWIASAKKDETRQRRLGEAVGLLERDKRLGLGPGEVRK